MRHRKQRGKLSRPTGARLALLRNLMIALIEHEKIRTTEAKAKVLRPKIERLVTLAAEGSLHSRRLAFSVIGKKHTVHKLFEEIGPLFKERPGGYTRIVKDSQRQGDGAWMAFIEFVTKTTDKAPVEVEAETV
ncbi:MAG: 50S ribosomal protein L17 [Sumerlaeia bacterium]